MVETLIAIRKMPLSLALIQVVHIGVTCRVSNGDRPIFSHAQCHFAGRSGPLVPVVASHFLIARYTLPGGLSSAQMARPAHCRAGLLR
jgi:hypothetical protein